jgi:hypothetical protein
VNIKPSDVSTLVADYLGITDKKEVARRFNNKDDCPLCIEIGDDDHDPQFCYDHVEYMADGASTAWW